MAWLNPDRFLTTQNFVSMSYQFPELGLLSIAIMISLLTGGIDLSIVSIANLSGIVAAYLLTMDCLNIGPSFRIGMAFAAALAVSGLCGLGNGWLIARARITPILATLGTMQLLAGFAYVLTKGYAVAGYPESFLQLGNGIFMMVPVPCWVFVAALVLFDGLLTRTRLGIQMYMIGSNPTAACFAGIDGKRVLLATYLLSGVLSGIAGLIVISRTNSAKADYGGSYLLQAVLVAILAGVNPRGGQGNVWGILLAVLSLQFLSSGLNMLMFDETFRGYINNFTKEFTWGVLLLFVMTVNQYFSSRRSRF